MTSKSVESNSVSFFFTSKILLGKSDSKIWPKYPQNSHSGQNYSHKTHYIMYCYIPKCSGNPSRGLRAPAHSIWPNFVPSRIFSRRDPWYWTMILNCVLLRYFGWIFLAHRPSRGQWKCLQGWIQFCLVAPKIVPESKLFGFLHFWILSGHPSSVGQVIN